MKASCDCQFAWPTWWLIHRKPAAAAGSTASSVTDSSRARSSVAKPNVAARKTSCAPSTTSSGGAADCPATTAAMTCAPIPAVADAAMNSRCSAPIRRASWSHSAASATSDAAAAIAIVGHGAASAVNCQTRITAADAMTAPRKSSPRLTYSPPTPAAAVNTASTASIGPGGMESVGCEATKIRKRCPTSPTNAPFRKIPRAASASGA